MKIKGEKLSSPGQKLAYIKISLKSWFLESFPTPHYYSFIVVVVIAFSFVAFLVYSEMAFSFTNHAVSQPIDIPTQSRQLVIFQILPFFLTLKIFFDFIFFHGFFFILESFTRYMYIMKSWSFVVFFHLMTRSDNRIHCLIGNHYENVEICSSLSFLTNIPSCINFPSTV